MNYIYYYNSPLGKIILSSNGKKLNGLWFENQRYFNSKIINEYEEKFLPIFENTINWLNIYFSGQKPNFTPPLYLEGSEFRKKVWSILLTIPYGKTMSYGEIAKKIDGRLSPQAVGGAVGHNPVSIIVPCHRVVGKNGSLVGYAGGVDKKLALLKLENGDILY